MLEAVAREAAALVEDGARVGLGSGRAAEAWLEALAARVREGLRVVGIPTSTATGRLAASLGIPVDDLDERPLDLTVDGADEVAPNLDLVKGFGGALVRERIVAAASRRQVIVVGEDKLVPTLGTRGRLPVEVVPFGEPLVRRRVRALGLAASVRTGDDGRPFRSDNGNVVLDLAVGPLADPAPLDAALRAIPGVVGTGLFLGTASLVLVGTASGVRRLERG
jgi:ribose 5-phosphate isomerase A